MQRLQSSVCHIYVFAARVNTPVPPDNPPADHLPAAHLPAAWAAGQLRQGDRERFVTALFAPAARRDDLMVLYAFNLEVARVRELVREPLAGAIRLQWWREVVEGTRPADETRRHPVAGPLRRLLAAGDLPAETLLCLLAAREAELDRVGFADLAALESYAGETAGGLAEAALCLLGAADADTLAAGHAAGTAYGLAGLLRAVPRHLAQGWLTLPQAGLAEAGTSAEAVLAGRGERASIAAAAAQVGARAAALLAEARRRPTDRAGLAVLLAATQAGAALRRLAKAGWDPFAAGLSRPLTVPLRLTVNALRGRY